ncbi:hypothetical protein LCGC14_1736930 [marine sediment metagenome]|uniref:GIY-YIG domain-containing protein n=1 Tax=marine sediment metagenome TaxID=412755 RepID=A0A0F9H7Q9_9ZZZZ
MPLLGIDKVKYYIYMYLDPANVPFYIGKGQGDRYLISKHLTITNRLLRNKIRKVGVTNVKIHFLHENLTEKEAFSWERYWIKYIGRRDLKEGTLCNLTDGGEGTSGHTHTEESKQKMSEALRGKLPWNKGKQMSVEYCRVNSESHKGLQAGEKNILCMVKVILKRLKERYQ